MAKESRGNLIGLALMGLVLFFVFWSWEEDYTCQDEGRLLTDNELLEKAFAYEVEERDLPEPYVSLGLEGLRETNPGCCLTMRAHEDGYRDPPPQGFLSRLISEPYYFAFIDWDVDPDRLTHNSTLIR